MHSLFYKALENPAVYGLSQLLLAPGAQRQLRRRYREIFDGSTGIILDVGCGPNLTTPKPRKGTVVGIDQNRAYVERYAGSVQDNPDLASLTPTDRVVGLVASADALPFVGGVFDEARCVGLLHHLPPTVAHDAVSEMCRCTRAGGRIVILDAVLPKSAFRRPLAWVLRKADRGEWVRTEPELVGIVKAAWPGDWSQSRFTYSYNGLETVCLTVTKSASNRE